MNPAVEIESVVRSYLEGQRTLSELEEWLAPNLPFLFQLPESAFASRLAARIEQAIAEMDAEGLGEEHLKSALRELLPVHSVTVVFSPAVSDAASTSSPLQQELLPEPPDIRVGFGDSPFSSSAVTVVESGEPSCTSA